MNGKVNSYLEQPISLDGELYNGKFEYAVEHNTNILNYFIDIDYKILDRLYFNSRIGLSTISSFDYYQYEKLVRPNDIGYFIKEDGKKSRLNNEYKGSLEIDNVNPILSLGFYYEMPMNKKKNLNLIPSIDYNFQFGEMVPSTSWNFNGLKLGLGINYYFHKDSATVIDEVNIDRTLLLAPTFVNNNAEKLKNIIEYTNYNFDINVVDIGLAPKEKFIKYNKILCLDDTLRFYYKFDKFSNVKEISLNISDKEHFKNYVLKQNENKIDFSLADLTNIFSTKMVANLKLTDKQRVYVKNAYSIVEKDYYSNSVILNFEEKKNVNGKITLFRWKGALDKEDRIEMLLSFLDNKENIKYVFSNSEVGFELVRELNNINITYNPKDDMLRALIELIDSGYYIVVYEN